MRNFLPLSSLGVARRFVLRRVFALLLLVAGVGALLPVESQAATRPVNSLSDAKDSAKGAVSRLDRAAQDSIAGVYKKMHKLTPIALNLSQPEHRAFFLAHNKAAGISVENNAELAKFMKAADEHYAANGMPKSGFVFLKDGKLLDENGAETEGPVGPVLTITSFQQINGIKNKYGVSGLVSLPGQPQTCTQTLQVFDNAGNPQGEADVNTQTLACENSQLYAEGQLDPSDAYASAHLIVHGIAQNGTPFAYAVVAEGSPIPTKIVSTDPNDKNGDNMIKFCFGRTSSDCDYSPSGSSQSNVVLPINGNTTWNSAVANPATDPLASVYIAITQPQPQAGGGCNLVADVKQFLQQNVTLSNNNMTVNWNGPTVKFPAINSVCMPNGSIVFYNMSMNVDLASNVPTFFGISSSPDTPISTGFYLMLPSTRVYYSCLTADTQVALKDGTSKAIEDVREGDVVVSGPTGSSLKVSSIYVGTEDKPLVQVTTRNGLVLTATQGHPVITNRGVRLARFLKAGDVLKTAKGSSPIETVKQVSYEGKVYNLSLVSTSGDRKIKADKERFYGNGVLVGGNEMQWRYDRPDAQASATSLEAPVPHMSQTARALLSKRLDASAEN